MHAIGFFFTIAIGAACVWIVGLSMRDLGHLEGAIPGTPSTTI
jgi:hypothetical protein